MERVLLIRYTARSSLVFNHHRRMKPYCRILHRRSEEKDQASIGEQPQERKLPVQSAQSFALFADSTVRKYNSAWLATNPFDRRHEIGTIAYRQPFLNSVHDDPRAIIPTQRRRSQLFGQWRDIVSGPLSLMPIVGLFKLRLRNRCHCSEISSIRGSRMIKINPSRLEEYRSNLPSTPCSSPPEQPQWHS